jgi:hypothetical protein
MARKKLNTGFTCSFCDKTFVTERGLINHACRQKLRYMDKDTPYARFAFYAFSRFYEIGMRSNKKRTYDEFIKSKYYLQFIQFGKYLINDNILEPKNFIDFVIRGSMPLDKWANPSVYEIYLRDIAKKEPAERGVERTILLMCQWANETNNNYYDFFREIEPTLFVHYIKQGRISPWVLYNCESGKHFLTESLSEEQINMIQDWIKPDLWAGKFKVNKEEREKLIEFFKEQGL